MTTGASDGAILVGIALRSGGSLGLWSDRLEAAGTSYPLADIAWAGMVSDPAAPQGAQPLPAVAWRLSNGQYASVTPADPPQAWQALEALYTQRPDLRSPLPPPPGYPGYGAYVATPVYPPYGYAPPQSNDNQTVMAGLAHLSIFFGALIVPLILWLVNRGKAPYAAQQSKQAFFFHLGVWVVEIVVIIVGFSIIFAGTLAQVGSVPDQNQVTASFFVGTIIFYVAIFAVQIVAIVFGIIGAVKAFKGEPFHYPLMARV